jgi:hypothetical protein
MTAEKFLRQSKSLQDMWDNTRGKGEWDEKAIINSHIEFAKYHVKQALKAALEDAPTGSSTDIPSYEERKDAILNSYPLENIR